MAWVAGLVVLLGSNATRSDEKAWAAEFKKAEGTWLIAEAIAEGQPYLEEAVRKSLRLVIKGDKYEIHMDGNVVLKLSSKVVAKEGKVYSIDGLIEDGPNKGKTGKSIMEWVDEDTLRVCEAMEFGDPRPTKFTGEKGSKHILIVYKRVKK